MPYDEKVFRGKIATSLPAARLAGPLQRIPDEVLEPDSDWKGVPVRTNFQHTADGTDELDCVTEATCNGIEMMAARKGIPIERISRSAIAMLSGTTRNGNTNENVNRAIKAYGLIPERLVPSSVRDWATYYDRDRITEEAYQYGEETKRLYDIDFLFLGWLSDETLKKHLQFSPLAIGIGYDDVVSHEVLMTSWQRDVIDSEIRSPNGESSFARLTPTRRIFSAMRVYIAPKSSVTPGPMPSIVIADRSKITVFIQDQKDASGVPLPDELRPAYYKQGKLMFGPSWMLNDIWQAENERDGFFSGGPMRTITLDQAKEYPWVDLKGQTIPYPGQA